MMKGKNFAPAAFLIAGVVAVALLAPKKRRGGSPKTYEIIITNEMIVDACDALNINDTRAIAEHIARKFYPEVPLGIAVDQMTQEIQRVAEMASQQGMTICDFAVFQSGVERGSA